MVCLRHDIYALLAGCDARKEAFVRGQLHASLCILCMYIGQLWTELNQGSRCEAGNNFIEEMDTLAYDLGKWLMPFRTCPSHPLTVELNDYTQLISDFVSLFKELKCASF